MQSTIPGQGRGAHTIGIVQRVENVTGRHASTEQEEELLETAAKATSMGREHIISQHLLTPRCLDLFRSNVSGGFGGKVGNRHGKRHTNYNLLY